MTDTIIIPNRFRGPPNSGNGGYVGGLFSLIVDPFSRNETEVTLRAPVPLDKPLTVTRSGSSASITENGTLIAEVKPTTLELELASMPQWDLVSAAATSSLSFTESIHDQFPGRLGLHPTCFCCGAEHEDGARVFAAPVGKLVAAIWQTSIDWASEDGLLPIEYLWTAMDCPGQFAYMAMGIRTGMLGRISAKVHKRPMAGEPLLVSAWPIQVDGKKHFAGAAIFDASGRLYSEAVTVWIGRRD